MSSGSEVGLIVQAQPAARRAGRRGARREHAEHGAVSAADRLVSGVGAAGRRAARGDRGGASDVVVQVGGGNGEVIGLTRFGASAPYEKIYKELGITVQRVIDTAKALVEGKERR